MGIRFWIKTVKDPEFSFQVRMMRLNEQYQGRWFFQDEWEELGLLNIMDYNSAWFKARGDTGDHEAVNPLELLTQIVNITEEEIEEHFFHAFDRPTPFWDHYTLQAINYMRLKKRYVRELVNAGIESVECKNVELPENYSQWYYYRDTPAVNRPPVYDKIVNEISRTRDL